MDDWIHLKARERVVDSLGLAPRDDEALAAQLGKMLGQGRLAEPRQPFQLCHALLAVQQMAEDEQPVLVPDGLEELRGGASGIAGKVCIHDC